MAQDLGVRYGDAIGGRFNNDANRNARALCTTASIEEIIRRHRVSRDEVTAATEAREFWVDLLAVFLPMSALFAFVSRGIIRRVVGGYEREDRWIAIPAFVVLAPVVAAVAVGVTQAWGVTVEQLRVRDEHISYRAFALPANRHWVLLWGLAMGLFAAIAALVSATAAVQHRRPHARR